MKSMILSLYTLLVVCMGAATIIEKIEGKDYAAAAIYGSWWFIALWALLTVAAVAYLCKEKVHRRPVVLLLHVAMVVMLVGALITHLTASSGKIHLRVGEEVKAYLTDEQRVEKLPFALSLTEFEVVNYPGSDAVMDYCCDVKVIGEKEEQTMSISMNHIGEASGYRFYQSAYDMDEQGTVLLVAHDPYGIAVTYTGYTLLLISLLWMMFSRQTRIRQLYRLATRPAMLALVLWIGAGSVLAQEGDSTELLAQNQGSTETLTQTVHETAPLAIPANLSHAFCKLPVSYNGRICPVNTAATEFVTKLSGKSSWQGYSADEIFVGWMIYYTEWEKQPIIRIKNSEVQRLLGIEGQWASVNDFYTNEQQYKLSGLANDYRQSDATRKAVREAEEKIQVITLFYNSEMLRLFPLTVEGHTDWYTPGSTELPLGTPEAEFQFINHVMDQLVQRLLVQDEAGAEALMAKIRVYQREKAGEVMPSPFLLRLEILYNTLQSARWVVFLCLTLSLLFCLLSLGREMKQWVALAHNSYLTAQGLFLTVLLVLRWCISGHVPMSNGFETMLFMAWASLLLTFIVMRRIPVIKAFGPVVSSLCMLVSMLAVGSPQITRLMPVLQSPLLTIHVALVMVAYALLAIITLVAMRSLWLYCQSRKEPETIGESMQSSMKQAEVIGESMQPETVGSQDCAELVRMNALSQLLLYPAVAFLAIGIFVGAVWANVSWGTYWSWDPKETWALITLMIYALPLHLKPQGVSWGLPLFLVLAFLTVLMTYFGVNYFLTGMHSYAG